MFIDAGFLVTCGWFSSGPSVTIDQKIKMPDPGKPIGQAVHQESSDERHGADGNRLGEIFLPVFSTKCDPAVFKGGDTAVCNRHPVG